MCNVFNISAENEHNVGKDLKLRAIYDIINNIWNSIS